MTNELIEVASPANVAAPVQAETDEKLIAMWLHGRGEHTVLISQGTYDELIALRGNAEPSASVFLASASVGLKTGQIANIVKKVAKRAGLSERRSAFVRLCVSEERFVTSGQVGWDLLYSCGRDGGRWSKTLSGRCGASCSAQTLSRMRSRQARSTSLSMSRSRLS